MKTVLLCYACLVIGACVGFVACALVIANGKDDEDGE